MESKKTTDYPFDSVRHGSPTGTSLSRQALNSDLLWDSGHVVWEATKSLKVEEGRPESRLEPGYHWYTGVPA